MANQMFRCTYDWKFLCSCKLCRFICVLSIMWYQLLSLSSSRNDMIIQNYETFSPHIKNNQFNSLMFCHNRWTNQWQYVYCLFPCPQHPTPQHPTLQHSTLPSLQLPTLSLQNLTLPSLQHPTPPLSTTSHSPLYNIPLSYLQHPTQVFQGTSWREVFPLGNPPLSLIFIFIFSEKNLRSEEFFALPGAKFAGRQCRYWFGCFFSTYSLRIYVTVVQIEHMQNLYFLDQSKRRKLQKIFVLSCSFICVCWLKYSV